MSPHPPSNTFVKALRTVYNPIGFTRGYNFTLFVIFAGALLGFTLARLPYLAFNSQFCGSGSGGAAPGECYYYMQPRYNVGIKLHLYCILPASFLAVWQFVPIIRHRAILFHRINGYLIVLLALVANAGALMIARVAFGGDLSTQGAVGVLVILTTVSIGLAYYNIKRLQIDQHRAWMLRTWFYFGTIITTRLIMITTTTIISSAGTYYASRPCAQLDYIFRHSEKATTSFYPACASYYNTTSTSPSATATSAQAIIHADFNSSNPAEIGVALGLPFGMSLWIALWLHAVGVETYLRLTPKEAGRLRQVSYERQVEAGLSRPGDSGLTVQRCGDAEGWVPDTGVGKMGGEVQDVSD
ncbi:hypothetical protein K402DRAFT_335803 [Aulographum hederae CBS 113979]|uniref:DUF2306 domain-containing protein n=1 Tax=Aulographum hederae CBS 113979 TaxID=1176131 RepID=A0A6G1GV98_9PEZI|nr:hypothetical protein K402DRAFT_335803 [Aulographum hederae CBS 113979]